MTTDPPTARAGRGPQIPYNGPMPPCASKKSAPPVLLAALLALLAGCGGGPGEPARGGGPPPIVLVLVDTLRDDYLGAYGFEGDISPRIDELAATGVRFANSYSQAPWTKPAVASLFTSLYPSGHGITNHEGNFAGGGTGAQRLGILGDAAHTLAERLQELGYRTAAFVANPWLGSGYGFDQGFELYDDELAGNEVAARDVLARAQDWVDEREPGEPWFLYLHLMDVHGPYHAADADVERASGFAGVQTPMLLSENDISLIPDYLKRQPWVRSREGQKVRNWRARYAAGVVALDRQLGEFLDGLDDDGWLDRAWVLLTSDHGEELYEHRGWDHGYNLYEHQLRVPLLARPPGGLSAPRVVGPLVRQVDLLPTLVALAGGGDPGRVEGRDLGPLLRGEPGPGPVENYASAVRNKPRMASLKVGPYKLIWGGGSRPGRLFDVQEDPGEQRDLAVEHRPLARELTAHLRRISEALDDDQLFVEDGGELSAKTREQLRALGYID